MRRRERDRSEVRGKPFGAGRCMLRRVWTRFRSRPFRPLLNFRGTAFACLLAGLTLLLAAAPGRAQLVSPGLEPSLLAGLPQIHRGMLVSELNLVAGFDAETRASLQAGLPITVRYQTELWRARKRWFDKQIDARVETFRVHWDPGERRFLLTYPRPRERQDRYEELDELLGDLSARTVDVYPRWDLDPAHRYFALFEVAIQPITLEEFRELDGWIRGRIGGDRPEPSEAEETVDSGWAETVFRFLVDLAGFGDAIFRARTPEFRLSELSESR